MPSRRLFVTLHFSSLCAEILSILIRKNCNINGLTVENNSIYADDTVITLDGSKEDLQETQHFLNKFAMGSGLTINKQAKKKSYMDR